MNDLDYGVEQLIEESDNSNIVDISNPFYCEIFNSPVLNFSDYDLYSQYKHIFVLCNKNNVKPNANPNLNILQKFIKKENFEELGKLFTLVKASNKLLKNLKHKKDAKIIEKDVLEYFNHFQYKLNETEIVILLLELTEQYANKYISLYSGLIDMENYVDLKILCDYYNCDKCKIVDRNLSQFSKCISNIKYWTFKWNCNLNITREFINRSFSYTNNRNTIKYVKAQVNDIENPDIKTIIESNKNKNTNDNYLIDIEQKQFIDVDINVKDKHNYRHYIIRKSNLNFSKEQVIELFENINDNEIKKLYNLFNSFLLSKEYCHLVINNGIVLRKMSHVIQKFKPIYKYLFGYPLLALRIEESISKTFFDENSRHVFDIEDACELPYFPYCGEDPWLNPYFTLLVKKTAIDSSNNMLGIPFMECHNYGISNLQEFKLKFNIFTTGLSDVNIFDGIERNSLGEWKHFAIGGSSIVACSIKNIHPMIDVISTKDQTLSNKLLRFFNEYFKKSDIDIMCTVDNLFDYIDQCEKLITIVKTNIEKFYGDKNSSQLQINYQEKSLVIQSSCQLNVTPIKNVLVIISKEYIEKCMDHDFDYVKNNLDNDELLDHFYTKYIISKNNKNKQLKKKYDINKNYLYRYFFKLSKQNEMGLKISKISNTEATLKKVDYASYIFLNDILPDNEQVVPEKNIVLLQILESIKFKLSSPKLLHNIEIFKLKWNQVARFHLDCVRAAYNGKTVKMLPSFISALMTFTNLSYKYFSGKTDIVSILLKYLNCGFGTIINNKEKDIVTQYINTLHSGNELYNGYFGNKTLNDNIFRPGKYLYNIPNDAYKQQDRKYIHSVEDLKQSYKHLYNYDEDKSPIKFLTFKTIKEDGNILPFQTWILEAGYQMLKQ